MLGHSHLRDALEESLKRRFEIWMFSLVTCSTLSGCATQTDVAVEESLGDGRSALLGASVGGASGTAVGDAKDQRERHENVQAAVSVPEELIIQDVVFMTQNNMHEAQIIKHIQTSQTVFHLNAAAMMNLKTQGVSESVINAILDTNRPKS